MPKDTSTHQCHLRPMIPATREQQTGTRRRRRVVRRSRPRDGSGASWRCPQRCQAECQSRWVGTDEPRTARPGRARQVRQRHGPAHRRRPARVTGRKVAADQGRTDFGSWQFRTVSGSIRKCAPGLPDYCGAKTGGADLVDPLLRRLQRIRVRRQCAFVRQAGTSGAGMVQGDQRVGDRPGAGSGSGGHYFSMAGLGFGGCCLLGGLPS